MVSDARFVHIRVHVSYMLINVHGMLISRRIHTVAYTKASIQYDNDDRLDWLRCAGRYIKVYLFYVRNVRCGIIYKFQFLKRGYIIHTIIKNNILYILQGPMYGVC